MPYRPRRANKTASRVPLQAHQERNGADVRPALEASAWYELALSVHGAPELRIDVRSSVASATHEQGQYSLFVEATH